MPKTINIEHWPSRKKQRQPGGERAFVRVFKALPVITHCFLRPPPIWEPGCECIKQKEPQRRLWIRREPMLIIRFRHANTIYSYQVRKWRVACTEGRRHFQRRRDCATDINQIIISGPVYFPTRSISQATDESLVGRLHSGPALLNA